MDFKVRNSITDLKIFHLERYGFFRLRFLGASLGGNSFTFFISFGLELIVLFDSFQKGCSAVTFSNMFSSNMDSFFDFSLFNLFMEDKTYRSRINIKYFGSSSMIKMMRHTFMDSTVNDNIDVISLFMGL